MNLLFCFSSEHIIIKILAVTIHHLYTADHLDMVIL